MGNGWHEWPLIIFTVFGQCVAGGFIVLALALMMGRLNGEQQQWVIVSMSGLWVMMGIGFIASALHPGMPLRLLNALNRSGSSALSNEIVCGMLFFAAGGLGWLLALVKKLSPMQQGVWLVVTMTLGVFFVWMMARVYSTIETVPTWHRLWTPVSFFLTVVTAGSLCGYLLLRIAGVSGRATRLLPVIMLLGVVASALVALMQGGELATIHSSVQQASMLVPDYGTLMAWRLLLLTAALICWIAPPLREGQPALLLPGLAFVLMMAGEMIGRGVFYGLHMTVGMAVAG